MKTITLSATFDGEHIRLEEDFPLRKDARLLVTVVPDFSAAEREEHDEWTVFALQSLARAYGENEPEYSDDMIIEPNPLYEKR